MFGRVEKFAKWMGLRELFEGISVLVGFVPWGQVVESNAGDQWGSIRQRLDWLFGVQQQVPDGDSRLFQDHKAAACVLAPSI